MMSQRVKNKKVRHKTKSSGVTVVLYTLWRLLWSITVHTHTGKCNLFVLYNKNPQVYWRILGGMKKEKQVCWRDLTWIWRNLCVCPLIDHGQQPMKMHTEVTLYNVIQRYCNSAWMVEYGSYIYTHVLEIPLNYFLFFWWLMVSCLVPV